MPDVFPLRNLPTDAEEWGRTVEDRIYQAENALSGSKQSLAGLNRATGSTLENLAFQVQEVQRLYEAIPVATQRTSTASNFAVPTTAGWNNITAVTMGFPRAGNLSLNAVASGQLVSGGSSTLMTATYRIVANSSASPAIPGLFASPSGTFVNNFMTTWGWNIAIADGATVTLTLQCRPDDGASWPSGTGSSATLVAYGVFSRG